MVFLTMWSSCSKWNPQGYSPWPLVCFKYPDLREALLWIWLHRKLHRGFHVLFFLDLGQENIRYKTEQVYVFMYVLTSGVFSYYLLIITGVSWYNDFRIIGVSVKNDLWLQYIISVTKEEKKALKYVFAQSFLKSRTGPGWECERHSCESWVMNSI